ncbi:hypothetical protein FA95DRAFT_1578125 [Auriscalpium vulgare]|uniref:Uncharacterized protein n=1 Tax=Auriscalpium vulgare TaxID=40419 RepID=A0ACB8R3S0_9AGAM|nr:hypothetical protein FA95DRAFT_1578125 [Auriscalpium vulgare]
MVSVLRMASISVLHPPAWASLRKTATDSQREEEATKDAHSCACLHAGFSAWVLPVFGSSLALSRTRVAAALSIEGYARWPRCRCRSDSARHDTAARHVEPALRRKCVAQYSEGSLDSNTEERVYYFRSRSGIKSYVEFFWHFGDALIDRTMLSNGDLVCPTGNF